MLVGTHREPLWPAGVVGSLTHCNDYCAAAVARAPLFASLGIDAETSEELDPGLRNKVCTPAELEWIGSQPPPRLGDWHKVIFSAKESAYKCLHPFVLRVLEFAEVEIRLQPSSWEFGVQLHFEPPAALRDLPVVCGRFHVGPEYIVTGASMKRGPGAAPS